MTPILAFDIETIPDAHAIRTLHDFPNDISDADVVEFALQKRRAQNGSDFLPLHLHRVWRFHVVCAGRTTKYTSAP